MQVITCEHAGFCFGAGKGVDFLEKALEQKDMPVYTYGPILNNDILVKSYEDRGVRVINSPKELEKITKGKLIIRAHGIPKTIYEQLTASGLEIIDGTCPFVKRIHDIVAKESEAGKEILVIGNPVHPEVEGIVGWSKNGATVIESVEEAEKFVPNPEKILCVVSQTTFNTNKFKELVEILRKKSYNILVMSTICNATSIRQQEAAELSSKAEVMIVIGDSKSSNSKKLFEICKQNCSQTFFIQTLDDIIGRLPKVSGVVGITAGASTPKNIIEEVQSYVRNDF